MPCRMSWREFFFGRAPEVPVGSFRIIAAYRYKDTDRSKLTILPKEYGFEVEEYRYGYLNDSKQYYWWPWLPNNCSVLDKPFFKTAEEAEKRYNEYLEEQRQHKDRVNQPPITFVKQYG